MQHSPTALVTPVPALSAEPASAKFPVIPLMVAVLAGSFITAMGVGGIAYYLVSTGRLSHQRAVTTTHLSGQFPTHLLMLEPIVVNLADSGGNAYLRVSIAVKVADATDKKPKQSNEVNATDSGTIATLRDTVLTELGKQTSDNLLAVDGKERLKDELKTAFAKRNAELKVVDIFFTDFLVQR